MARVFREVRSEEARSMDEEGAAQGERVANRQAHTEPGGLEALPPNAKPKHLPYGGATKLEGTEEDALGIRDTLGLWPTLAQEGLAVFGRT